MEILLAEQTTAVSIAVWGEVSADTPNTENPPEGGAVPPHAVGAVGYFCELRRFTSCSRPQAPVSERRLSGVAHALTPGGSCTSFRSSI